MPSQLSCLTPVDGNESSSEHLAERCQTGCRESFDLLVQRFGPRLYHYLFQLVQNRHDAEDLTQETFLKAYRNIGRYEARFSFATWLFTIAKRSAYSHWRSAKRVEVATEAEEIDFKDPSVLVECDDERASLWKLAKELKPKQYEALWLRYGEGFAINEVASIMGSNQIYVKVLLHRARAQLAKRLRPSRHCPKTRDAGEPRSIAGK
jgi:RNA polymerase sigma-70 factor, ECF subfamily